MTNSQIARKAAKLSRELAAMVSNVTEATEKNPQAYSRQDLVYMYNAMDMARNLLLELEDKIS